MASQAQVRIGELSRRVGVSPALLRAWERRYGLLEPQRTDGGLRLYGPEDDRRVRDMQAGLRRGLSAAEAARAALVHGVGAAADMGIARDSAELAAALGAMDAEEANLLLDRLLATFTLETAISDVILPYLHELGEAWSRGEASVAQEHFASNLIRGRLMSLARGWEAGAGPLALLACAPGDLHDLPLICFGLALRQRGWRIAYLGTDTPIASLAEASEQLRPQLVVVCAITPASPDKQIDGLRGLAETQPLALAGPWADPSLAQKVGGRLLRGDPVTAAAALTRYGPQHGRTGPETEVPMEGSRVLPAADRGGGTLPGRGDIRDLKDPASHRAALRPGGARNGSRH